MAENTDAFCTGIRKKAEELENILCNSNPGQMYDDLEKHLLSFEEIKVNIAVVGLSGSGKSSFINAILGLEDSPEEKAETGVIEMTKSIKPYSNKHNKNVIFWDLPGVGTPSFERKSYANDTHLEKYDCFLILSSGRFRDEDVWLAKYANESKRKFYFVRTHVEQDLENDQVAYPTKHVQIEVLAAMRKNCKDNLEHVGIRGQEVFLVDSFEKNLHDFKRLSEKLVTETNGLKACLIAHCIGPVTTAVIQQKRNVLQERINKVAKVCGSYHRCPDTIERARRLFISETSLYRRVFEVNEVSIRHHANLFQLSPLEVSKELRQLQALNQNSSFMCGFSLTTGILGKDCGMFELVAILLFDYLNRLCDHAIKQAEMLNAEVSKKIYSSHGVKGE